MSARKEDGLCGFCNRLYDNPLVYNGTVHHHDNLQASDAGIAAAAKKYGKAVDVAAIAKCLEQERADGDNHGMDT